MRATSAGTRQDLRARDKPRSESFGLDDRSSIRTRQWYLERIRPDLVDTALMTRRMTFAKRSAQHEVFCHTFDFVRFQVTSSEFGAALGILASGLSYVDPRVASTCESFQ
jgi:hypothetical protein